VTQEITNPRDVGATPVTQDIRNLGNTGARPVTQEIINPRNTGALLRRLTEQVEILAGDRRSAADQAAVRKGDIAAVIDQAVTAALAKAGIIRDASRDLKVLGGLSEGQTAVKVKLDITANRVSAAARKLVEDAGGKVSETGTRKDRVRGVDRNAEDRTPKNLTKKLKKQAWHKARDEAFARGEVLKPRN
jgi:ribosomal protein L15